MNLQKLQLEFIEKLTTSHKSLNTIKNYKTDLNGFNSFLKKQDSNELTAELVRAYGDFLDTKYSSNNSRRRKVQTLRIFFDFILSKGLIDNNPVKQIPTSPKFLDIPRPTPLIDIKTLWVYLLENKDNDPMTKLINLRNQVLTLLIFGAGLKVSQLANIKLEHVFEGPRILITNRYGDPYTIPLPTVFQEIFDQYQIQLENCKQQSKLEFDQLLFNANAYRILSGGLSPRGIELILEDFRNKLEIHLTPKSLRQACIYKWIQQRIPIETIKEWIGVAPSYSLDHFVNSVMQNAYCDNFLSELYKHYK